MSTSLDIDDVLSTLRQCLPDDAEVGLHEPAFEGEEWIYVKECLDTGWVSSAGAYVDRFEDRLADYTGVERAVAVVNGTAALHIALQLAGVTEEDEVLVPALTFVATANAVRYCGAVPHFVDAEPHTLGMDADALADYLGEIGDVRDGTCYNQQTGRPIRAVLPMHTFGHPVDLDSLVEVADAFGLAVVEDAAEALGSEYKGRHVGRAGDLATLSFNGNKTITTGGGGAILTDDEALAEEAKHLTTTAKVDQRYYYHDRVGYNYRLPNINAALGCAQMEQLPSFLERKRTLAARYTEAFASVDGVTVVQEPSFARSNYWLNAIMLDERHTEQRAELLRRTNEAGIMTRPPWTLMSKLPMYETCPRMDDLSGAERLEQRIVNLPSSASLASVES